MNPTYDPDELQRQQTCSSPHRGRMYINRQGKRWCDECGWIDPLSEKDLSEALNVLEQVDIGRCVHLDRPAREALIRALVAIGWEPRQQC
jgi:hypothetical protein